MKQNLISFAAKVALLSPTTANHLPKIGNGMFISDCHTLISGLRFCTVGE